MHPTVRQSIYIDTLIRKRGKESRQNTEDLVTEIQALQGKKRQAMQAVDNQRRKLVTFDQTSREAIKFRVQLKQTLQRLNELERALADLKVQEHRRSQARDKTRRELREAVLQEAHVVCTTLGACKELSDWYRTVIIDEAAQSTEPQALVPVAYGCRQCTLVGDPKQLPPTVLSRGAMRKRYDYCLMARLLSLSYPSLLLDTQYRMDPLILEWPNRQFYHGDLQNGPNVLRYRAEDGPFRGLLPYCFLDVPGTAVQARSSWHNHDEALCVVALFELLKRRLAAESGPAGVPGRTGVITPYQAQKRLLQQVLRSNGYAPGMLDVNTVDGPTHTPASTPRPHPHPCLYH